MRLARKTIAEQYKSLLEDPGNIVILDTETTGANQRSDQPVSIAAIDGFGNVLMNQRVKPTIPIHPRATKVHGMTAEDLVDEPSFAEIAEDLARMIDDKALIIYNVKFDVAMLRNAGKIFNIHAMAIPTKYYCAMLDYAEFNGTAGRYGTPKWWKLTDACGYEGIEIRDAHDALGDCKMTLEIVKRMARDA